MAFLEWTEKCKIHIPEMDEHHQHLFLLLNTMYDRVAACQTLEEERHLTGDLLSELVDYAAYHFSAEETLMQQAKFPSLADHQSEHAWFCNQLAALSNAYEKGGVAMSFDAFIFLRDWIVNHVLTKDAEYVPYVMK